MMVSVLMTILEKVSELHGHINDPRRLPYKIKDIEAHIRLSIDGLKDMEAQAQQRTVVKSESLGFNYPEDTADAPQVGSTAQGDARGSEG